MKKELYEKPLDTVRTYDGDSVSGDVSSLHYESVNGASHMPTIAVFGAYGTTGMYFSSQALDAGYHVHALILPELVDNKWESLQHRRNFSAIHGNLDDEKKVRAVLEDAQCVVCLLNDTIETTSKQYPKKFLSSFVEFLYPIMKETPTIRVFLYQATSLAKDARGNTPVLSQVIKTVAHRRNAFLKDQDAIISFIASQHACVEEADDQPTFSFIVTRPTVLLKEGPAGHKKLKASKSQPGPFPIHYVDLASFSLDALQMERLYNTSPYVVADTF